MDEFDAELISYIDSGTIKYTDLAKKMNTPISTIHFRVKKLEKEKIIKYYKGEIDWKKAGYGVMAYVLISVDINMLRDLKKTQDMLLEELMQLSYVMDGNITTSEADVVLRIIAKDTQHLKEIILSNIQSKPGIVNTKTMVVLG